MRFMVYIAATLIAAGLVYVIGNSNSATSQSDSAAVASSEVSTSTEPTDGESGEAELTGEVIALDVPGMHCAFGCYPTVKEALESVDGVSGVKLAEQKSEMELDDKTVYVSYTDAFNLETALSKLSEAGFDATKIE